MKLNQLHESSFPPGSVGAYLKDELGVDTFKERGKDSRYKMWMVSIVRQGLTSLEGSPLIVTSNYNVPFNDIISLEGITPYIGTFCNLNGNPLISLQNIHKHIKRIGTNQEGGVLHCQKTHIASNILGVLLIKNLKQIHLVDPTFSVSQLPPDQLKKAQAQIIINKYLKKRNKDIHACQQEMIDAGLAEFAKL